MMTMQERHRENNILDKKKWCVHCITLYHNTGVTGRMMFALMHCLFLRAGLHNNATPDMIQCNTINIQYNYIDFLRVIFQ